MMIRGECSFIFGCVMIFSRLVWYSSRGTCCLLGASGNELSLAPKNIA